MKDINGKSMHLSGVTLGRPELEDLLRMAGASYDPKTLNEPPARAQKSKEFQVVKQDRGARIVSCDAPLTHYEMGKRC